jgi:hypothetical protein
VSRSLACLRTVLPDRPFLLAIRRLAFNQSNLDSLSRATAHSQSSGYSAWASWRIDSVPDNSPSRNQPNRFFWISLRNFSTRAWSKDRIQQGVRPYQLCESVVSPKKLVDLGHNPNICLVGTQNLPVRFSRSRQPLRPLVFGCTVSLQTVVPIVVAFGLCAMYTRCRSLSPLDRPIQGLLYPGYRFSGRYVLAGSSGQVRANHGSDRMAGPPRGKVLADRDNAGPHERPTREPECRGTNLSRVGEPVPALGAPGEPY